MGFRRQDRESDGEPNRLQTDREVERLQNLDTADSLRIYRHTGMAKADRQNGIKSRKRPGRKARKVTQEDMLRAQRDGQIIREWMEGRKTRDELARDYELTNRRISEIINRELLAVSEIPAQHLRKRELQILDSIHAAMWPIAIKGQRKVYDRDGYVYNMVEVTPADQLKAVDKILKVSSQRAKLCGLNTEKMPQLNVLVQNIIRVLEISVKSPEDRHSALIGVAELVAGFDPEGEPGLTREVEVSTIPPPRPRPHADPSQEAQD